MEAVFVVNYWCSNLNILKDKKRLCMTAQNMFVYLLGSEAHYVLLEPVQVNSWSVTFSLETCNNIHRYIEDLLSLCIYMDNFVFFI